ncbi:MAG: hypothetical protein ABWY66_14810 [Xanthobacteraceae bacterium]|jgi:hypothetical protein
MKLRIVGHRRRCIAAGLAAGLAGGLALVPAQVLSQTKESALLADIDKAHCTALYDVVELRLKGKGDEIASITTRNGLKDFFVTRPGMVDCSGQREIPWRDNKDREFIDAVLNATNEALKSNVDMAKAYGIGPAPTPTVPIR